MLKEKLQQIDYPLNFAQLLKTLFKEHLRVAASAPSKGFAILSANLRFLNSDLNRVCLVYMFSLRFSRSKFLINLRRQFPLHKIFSRRQLCALRQFLQDLQSFHFVFKIAKYLCVF